MFVATLKMRVSDVHPWTPFEVLRNADSHRTVYEQGASPEYCCNRVLTAR